MCIYHPKSDFLSSPHIWPLLPFIAPGDGNTNWYNRYGKQYGGCSEYKEYSYPMTQALFWASKNK